MNVTSKDFQLVNQWKPDLKGPKFDWPADNEPAFVIDQTTNRRYLNEDPFIVATKCVLLASVTPLAHSIASIVNVAYRTLKIITGAHFWMPKEGEKKYNFQARLTDLKIDALRIIATPVTILCLELSAIYGIIRPYDGRKLYATIERAAYGNFIIAPCFQPDPKYHAFGSDMKTKDGF